MTVLLLLIVFFLIRYIGISKNRKVPEKGINESLYVDINGTRQWINIYGKDLNNPLLLYLHGGPGSSTSLYDYAFTRKWSDVYTVVTWDQRGCGKSYDERRGPETITYDNMMQDGKEMTEFLLKSLSKEKLTLLGHSWGSLFGANLAMQHPEYYDAYIGTGQCIDIDENEKLFREAAEKWTEGDKEGQAMLEKLHFKEDDPMEYLRARNGLMKKYRYDMMKDGTDYNMFAAVLFNPNYRIIDLLKYILYAKKIAESYLDFLLGDLAKFSLLGRYKYEVPFYNINGDRDYQTSYQLACDYFERVEAPYKKMYVMEDATHGLLESRSEEFSKIVHDIDRIQKEDRN